MQKNMSISSSTDIDRPDEHIDESIETISRGFNRQLDLECDDDSNSKLLPDVEDDCENEDGDDDFTFMFVGGEDSTNEVMEDGEIRPAFPLFDQKLLLDGDYEVEEIDRLPIQPPVDKIFIQSPRGFPSSTASEHDDATSGPYCAWSKQSATAELSKKSNSTGFSKLWRLKEKGGRSNSYGRDAFVFFKSSDSKTTAATAFSSSKSPATGDAAFVNVNVDGGKTRIVKQGTKAKKSTVSAHEAYLKSRGQTEEERRRSYLPYRPELMGFFTNVHGGLTKNVHPY